jgi:hypothetical protein
MKEMAKACRRNGEMWQQSGINQSVKESAISVANGGKAKAENVGGSGENRPAANSSAWRQQQNLKT